MHMEVVGLDGVYVKPLNAHSSSVWLVLASPLFTLKFREVKSVVEVHTATSGGAKA